LEALGPLGLSSYEKSAIALLYTYEYVEEVRLRKEERSIIVEEIKQ
jgi:hypothetical protein